ncbi:EAL domain-containing protein [Paenibacillus mendelii]|uniref:EAL domain-containing protein n=1 Tax=Paenibacillus mendelii TaxID=206163 RepID=A0ABV6J4H0_9BACL|nr:EAL domain-containing protein [Paenibacillus mendelii]MCQ6561698.1 EAL domain-containing protein [Paenibacillus mendelii]
MEAYRLARLLQGGADNELIPYYQPILALDTRKIMGYEALARIQTGAGMRSLGPFFEDKTVPMNEQIRVDRLLREKALSHFSQRGFGETAMLFLNIKPSWMYQTYVETGELPTLRLLEQYGIDPRRIVIEITEEAFQGPMEQLRTVVDVYRGRGCRIAIDDVGSGFSNMDRIAQIEPHILKIDIHMLQNSENHRGYYGVLRSFSMLADQIGASLLVEGVETEQDFQRAIEIGARYVQGFLFARAEPELRPALSFAGMIERGLEERRTAMIDEERYWQLQAERLRLVTGAAAVCPNARPGHGGIGAGAGLAVRGTAGERVGVEQQDRFVESLLPELEHSCIRVYICDEAGIQLSSNYIRDGAGVWCREAEYRGLNWSWRPYFIPLSIQLEGDSEQVMVSRTYTDLDSFDRIRTLSVPMPENGILFADFSVPCDDEI